MTEEEFARLTLDPGTDIEDFNPNAFLPFNYVPPIRTQNIPIATAQDPAMVNYGIMGTDQANMFTGDYDDEYVPMPEEDSEEESGIANLLKFIMPGSFLRNILPEPQPYQQFSPGTTIRDGIVSVAGVNTPYNMFGGDFYNPKTGLNRFDRAAQRYAETGSTFDLFGSSRTGAEFFSKLRERRAAKRKALEDAANAKRNIATFTSGGDNDGPISAPTNTFTGGNVVTTGGVPGGKYGSPR